jgi:hypothetical protein
MTKKIITGVIAAILLVTIAVFAAEKVREKISAEKAQFAQGRLLDELVDAYKANDREKMGQILHKMQERREKMQKFAKLNRWHHWAHHRMMGPGWGQGQQMAGPAWNRGWAMAGPGWNRGWAMQGRGPNQGCPMAGPGWNRGSAMGCQCGNCCCVMRGQGPNQGCQMGGPPWGQFQAMRGRGFAGRENMIDNYQAMADEFRQMPWQQHGMGNRLPPQGGPRQMPCRQGGMGMGNCMPQQGCPMQMPGCGRGFQRDWTPGPGADNMGPQERNMPRRERQNNVPPPEWGW